MNWPWCERRSSSSLQEIDLFAIAESIYFVANFVAPLFRNTELACFDKVRDKVEDKVLRVFRPTHSSPRAHPHPSAEIGGPGRGTTNVRDRCQGVEELSPAGRGHGLRPG